MRQLFFLVSILLILVGCNNKKTIQDENNKTEKSVYLLKLNVTKESDHVTLVGVSKDTVFLSKGFWKMLVNKFPNVASKIFESRASYQWVTITSGDTTVKTKDFDSLQIMSLKAQLPNNLSGTESVDPLYPYKLISNETIQKDSSLLNLAKLSYIRYDYAQLINLLQDTTINQIEFCCKKEFLNHIIFKHQ